MHARLPRGCRTLRVAVALSLQGWFDDRVEARNALSKLPTLDQYNDFDRKELPWGGAGREQRIDVLMGMDARQFKH